MKRTKIISFLTLAIMLIAIALTLGLSAFAAEETDGAAPGSRGTINVWLIGGQSNAAGYGRNINDLDPRFTTGFENVLYYGYSEKWNTGFDPVKIGFGNTSSTSGAEIGIAKALGDTGEMNVIIKYAEGASCICPSTTDVDAQKRGTWTSPTYIAENSIDTDGTKVGLLYDNFIKTVQSAIAELERMGYTPVVKGMWWMQGEAETYISEAYANEYGNLLSSLISDVRSDVGNMVGADLSAMPFVFGRIYRNPSSSTLPYTELVQAQQEWVAVNVANTAIVNPTDYEKFVQHDGWHYDANTQCYLGKTFVEKANLINGEYVVEINGTNVSATGGGLYKNGETVTVTFIPKETYDIQSLTVKVGSSEAVSVMDKLNGMSYTFVCEGENVIFSAVAKSAYDVETAYGIIPKEYASEVDYPVALFNTAKAYLGVYQNVTDAVNAAMKNPGGDYVVLVRSNISQTNGTYISALTGSITLDLGGNTLTKAAPAYILECFYNGAAFNGGKLTVKNGTLVNKEWSSLFCYNYGASLSGDVSFDFEFENVEFISEYTAGKGKNVIIETWDDGKNTVGGIYADVVFNECIFNYTGAATEEVMLALNMGATRSIFNVTVNGGKIISDVTVGMSNFAKKDNVDSVKFGKGKNGYTVCVLVGDAKISEEQFDSTIGGKLSYSNGAYTDAGYVYTLGEDVITEYGPIPYKYTDSNTYPFIVFRNGAFVHAATHFGRDNDPSALSNGKVNGTVILMRRDFTYKESQYNNLSQTHTITIDLGGYTFTSVDRIVFSAQKKTTNNTNLTVKNGTFVLGSQPLMKFSSWDPATGGWTPYPGGNGFIFTFNNVNITLAEGATTKNVLTSNAFKTGDPDQFCNMTFNGCTFDLSGSANASVTLFDFTDAHCTANAVINGGVIKTSGLTFVSLSGGNANSSFTFGKSAFGYTVISVPENNVFDDLNKVYTTTDGVNCVFVKTSEKDGYVNYSLYPEVMADYKIKTSITLWSNFVYNIYIPTANVNGFTVNGNTVAYTTETIDGVEYYVVKVDLPAGETLKDIALTVTLNTGNTTVDANWTLNVYNYTKAVLGGNYDDTTKTLMKDMLVYAAAAHTYFENTEAVAEKLSEIKTLLGDYNATLPTGEAKAPADKTYFTDVAVYLGEVPSFRFYLASGYTAADFSFKVGNRTVEAKASEDGKYVEIVMYAYMMLDDVTYTVKGTDVTGTYNIYSYLDYAKNVVKDANLVAIVEALMKYSVSANAYRNSVINK